MLQPEASPVPEPLRGLHVSDVDWLQLLYPWLTQRPNWWIELRFLEDRADSGARNPPAAVQFLREPSEIAALLKDWRAMATNRAQHFSPAASVPWPAGVFWGVQPRVTQRSGRDRVAAFVALVANLDCDDWGEWPQKQRPRIMWEALHRCPQPPSLVTWTGSGFDAWWLLREPMFDKRRGEALQRAIAHSLHALPAPDAAGLCRWPGTVNYRELPHGRPRTGRVVWWQPEVRFPFSVLLERFLPYATLEPPRVTAARPAQIWRRFQEILEDDGQLRTLWARPSSTSTPQDRRALNVALASLLAAHDLDWNAYEILAPQASWNASGSLTKTELSELWREARGETQVAPTTPSVPPEPPATQEPAPAPLPGMLLGTLPETAWTDWARLYRTAVGASTEAANAFHYMALLTVLGTAFGRSVMVQCGRPLYPNLYTILVGPTGDRKSTAAQLALDLLARLSPRPLLLNGVGSQEGLMERMASAESSGQRTLWYVDEMAALLKKARRESSGGLIEFVTEVFHSPDFMSHSTRSKALHLEAPTLGILAGSTPTWLEGALQQDDILGGFANRFVFVTGHPKPDNALPSRPDAKALDRLLSWMQAAVQAPAREIGWSQGARALWCDFYAEWRRSTVALTEHVAALLRRIDLYILKFAAMAAAMDGTAEMSPGHLNAAIELGRFLAGCAYRLLGELGASNDCRLEALVEQKLREARGLMTRKHLRQTLGGRISGEKLDRVLHAMERNGLVHQTQDTCARGAPRLVQLT